MASFARSILSDIYSSVSAGFSRRAMQPIEPALSAEELENYRRLLLHLRVSISAQIARLQRDGEDAARVARAGGTSSAASALPDDSWIQAVSQWTIATKRTLLRDIDAALDRMARQVYGLCVNGGHPISRERLQEVPWARYCESCAARDPV